MASGTVIDSLVLELGLDPSKFTRGQREAMNQLRQFETSSVGVAKTIEAQGKKTLEFMSNLRREALTVLTVFLGGRGIKEFVGYVTSLDAATGRLAKTMAMSTQEVSVWQGAIKQTGGTAEGANAALSGLSSEMSRFQITGQSTILPVLSRLGVQLYDQNRNLKTAGQLWLDLADAVRGMDPRQAQSFLSMIPGANQEMINFALLGRRAMESHLEAARRAGSTTDASAEAARNYQEAAAKLDSAATNLGRALVTTFAPALVSVMDAFRKMVGGLTTSPSSPEGELSRGTNRDALIRKFGSPRSFWRKLGELIPGSAEENRKWNALGDRWWGSEGADEAAEAATAAAARQKFGAIRRPPAGGGPGMSPGYTTPTAEVEAYIRRAATARGIDPEVAVAVAKSEGLYTYKSTVPGEDSVGPFQLYYGGKGGGGLGPAFTKRTGLDAHDPSTWQAQVDFALDEARRGGWGPWHGWKGLPFAGIGRGGAASAPGALAGGAPGGDATTISTTIGAVNITAPAANDAEDVAREIVPALKRSISAGSANYGQQ